MHLPCHTSVWRRRLKEEESGGCSRAAAEEACARGRPVAVAEEADSSGVDDGGGDLRSRDRAVGLREFCDEK
jgi:hypothetical protein